MNEYGERRCWRCGKNGFDDPLEEHHIFQGSNRKNSTKYGLTVYLCGKNCHREGKYSVHRCRETRDELMRYGQKKVMEEQGWDVEKFIEVFGKNYL